MLTQVGLRDGLQLKGELIAAMKKRYPDLGEESSLELSAKVAKGEMKW